MRKKAATKGLMLALGTAVLGLPAQAQTLTERVTVLEEKISERRAQAEDAFVLDGTCADVSNIALANGRSGANWYGGAAYAIVNLTEKLQLTLRGEVFDDPDGIKTGLDNGATLWEASPALSYWFNDHLLWPVEYRHDESSKPLFPAENGNLWRGQDVFSTEFLVTL